MVSETLHEPVAIIGMGCRWPGGVRSAPELWEFLKTKADGWKEFDQPRFSSKGFHHPNADRPGTVSMKGAFLLEEDARKFDHSYFGITGLEAETMDPSQRKLLEVSYEAIENAGETWESISGSRTGVFVGNFCLDHWMIQSRDWDYPRPYAFVGAGTSILANRLSYIFNLHGPSLTVDTACSSSMYALHLAVNAIRAGDCDSAIVASANWVADPGVQIALDKLGALSASSRCHTFDAKGDGYARGEGFAALYLKKTTLATSDGSPIRAVIRGTAMNANGRTGGITRPSAAGQEAVIREAYRNAGNLPFSDTDYFECHGTGTYVGDPIEVSAVGNVFALERKSTDPLLVGSVKSNLGHTEGSSALAAIMKVVLALEHGQIPPVYNIETLNPNIDFEKANVKPVTELSSWPRDKMRRASINSFGYGGANAHCIIDHVNNVIPEYVAPGIYKNDSSGNEARDSDLDPGSDIRKVSLISNGSDEGYLSNVSGSRTPIELSTKIASGVKELLHSFTLAKVMPSHSPILEGPRLRRTTGAATRSLVLLPVSAHNPSSMEMNIDALDKIIGNFSLADVAFTLSSGRSRLLHRSFCITNRNDPSEGLKLDRKPIKSPLQPTNVGFVFTGQGAQWPAMANSLLQYRVFDKTIEYLDYILSRVPSPPTWTLRDVLSGNCPDDMIQTPEISQTACTALQVGLVDLLASWSVRPSGVVGHSSGEMAAAYASGHITAAEAILAAYCRGRAVSINRQTGSMLAVGLGQGDVARYLEGRENQVKIAAINSPSSVTLSGEFAAIEHLSVIMNEGDVFNRVLKTGGNAYHSHHMVPPGQKYVEMLCDGLDHIHDLGLVDKQQHYPDVPWISSVMPGERMQSLADPAAYWRANLVSTVCFSEALSKLVALDDTKIDALVEIGPHPALKSPVEQVMRSLERSVPHASTLKRKQDGQESLLQLAGTLFCLNSEINLVAVNATDKWDSSDLEHGSTSIDLPPYQYTYADLNYHESRASKEYRYRQVARHDLLGSKLVGTAKFRPQWRNILRMKDLPWLGDHRLLPDAILPAAGYVAIALEAASRTHQEHWEGTLIEGFLLQDLAIKTSLRIPEDDYGVEVMTSIEIFDTSSASSSTWMSFSVSSIERTSEEWSEHCTGRVRIETSKSLNIEKLHSTRGELRPVNARAWYKKLANIGLGYGPTFQPLSSIRADPDQQVTIATVALKTTNEMMNEESMYPLHPASLDGAIQLGLIACYSGHVEKATTGFVPIHLSRMYLKNGLNETSCTAIARGKMQGVRGANLDLQLQDQHGDLIMNIENLRCISYSNEAKSTERVFSSPFTRLVWKPDIRALDHRKSRELFPPPKENVDRSPLWEVTNKLAYMIVYNIFETFGKLDGGPKPSGDVGHFFDWIKRKGTSDFSSPMEDARRLTNEQRMQEIEDLVRKAPDVLEVKIAKLLHENMADILHERRTGIDVILGEELLTPLYQEGLLMTGIYPQLFEVLDHLGHANPNQRIVEIGGGTGGATRIAMSALNGANGIKAYQDYTFTDISPGFLSGARESLSEFRDFNYSVLDIEKDVLEQGYQPVQDLVIACQVLHATSDMHRTLSNVGKLLKPGGRLVLVETTQNFMVPGIVVGTFTGYWNGIPDGRIDAPFQSEAAWDSALRKAGFTGTDIVLDDFPPPNNTTSVIVSTFIGTLPETGDDGGKLQTYDIHLLHTAASSPLLLRRVATEVQGNGFHVSVARLQDSTNLLAAESRVILFIDEEHVLFDSVEQNFLNFQHIIRSAASLLVITSCGLVKARQPEGALLRGLLRVLGTENPGSRFASIDVDADHFEVDAAEVDDLVRCIYKVQDKLMQDGPNNLSSIDVDEPSDVEFVWQDGTMWVSRHVPDTGIKLSSDVPETTLLPIDSHGPVRAAFEVPGVPNSLFFKVYDEISEPLPPDLIDVKVAAVGLGKWDLDIWAGRTDANHLSSEYAGTVIAIGANVGNLKIGDRVFGVGKGQFSNITRVPAALACKIRQTDDFIQMSTMPVAYMTAVYALDHVARLKQEDRLLIESATTDVGLAAIQLAQAKGVDVFASVDTAVQESYLINKLGISPSRVVLPTGSDHPLHDIVKDIGLGFNVILSVSQTSLPQLLLETLAPFGHLINIQDGDRRNTSPIVPDLFQRNINFSSFNLFNVLEHKLTLGSTLLKDVGEYHQAGCIQPLHIQACTDVGQLTQVLPNLGKDGSFGKLVVTFSNPESLVKLSSTAPAARFDAEACYVITGGLGGLGRSIVRWMSGRGARHIVILSRRQLDDVPEARMLQTVMTAQGVDLQGVSCDVSDHAQTMKAISEISSHRPIKGIVHAAVSYLDLTFDKLSYQRWQQSLAAKVKGTRNLHEATLSMPLDFFVMTTSLLSVYALATQGAYTAANNFQDTFARYRRSVGLPASTASFSLINDIGDVGLDPVTIDAFERNKTITLSEYQFNGLFESAFMNNKSEGWKGQQQDPLSGANILTCLNPADMATKNVDEIQSGKSSTVIPPRWYKDARVSLIMRAFSDAQRHILSTESHSASEKDSQSSVVRLRHEFDTYMQAESPDRDLMVKFAERSVGTSVADMLFIDGDSVNPAASVASHGVDSLIAAELRNWFIQGLGYNISMLDLLDPNISISALAATIVDSALSQKST